MNDPDWVKCLQRAKMSQKYAIQAVHVLAPLRNEQGVAPVVLHAWHEYLRAPAQTEACFELCLRHLNRLEVPWPVEESITVPTLLANRATQALKLPNRFVPTADGDVLDMCEHSLQAPPTSGAESPASQDLPVLRAEWPVLHDSPALLGDAALPTDSPVSHGNATLRTDSPVSPRTAALPIDSPVSHGNAALPTDLLVSPENTAQRGDLPVGHHNASDAAAPVKTANVASSMSKRARRRAVFKARKQQVVRRW